MVAQTGLCEAKRSYPYTCDEEEHVQSRKRPGEALEQRDDRPEVAQIHEMRVESRSDIGSGGGGIDMLDRVRCVLAGSGHDVD
jgi:hypothetical protein